jgi:hypothetical protein
MGQNVEIRDVVEMDDVLLIDTDRSFTGQDGESITPQAPGEGVPGLLASRLFDLGLGIDYVFVLQNQVTVRRSEGWDDSARDQVTDVTRYFLRYYPDAEGDASEEE